MDSTKTNMDVHLSLKLITVDLYREYWLVFFFVNNYKNSCMANKKLLYIHKSEAAIVVFAFCIGYLKTKKFSKAKKLKYATFVLILWKSELILYLFQFELSNTNKKKEPYTKKRSNKISEKYYKIIKSHLYLLLLWNKYNQHTRKKLEAYCCSLEKRNTYKRKEKKEWTNQPHSKNFVLSITKKIKFS